MHLCRCPGVSTGMEGQGRRTCLGLSEVEWKRCWRGSCGYLINGGGNPAYPFVSAIHNGGLKCNATCWPTTEPLADENETRRGAHRGTQSIFWNDHIQLKVPLQETRRQFPQRCSILEINRRSAGVLDAEDRLTRMRQRGMSLQWAKGRKFLCKLGKVWRLVVIGIERVHGCRTRKKRKRG